MARASLSERALDLTTASARASRNSARRRARRLRQRAYFIVQCATAAALAYTIARYVFDVPVPLFAPVAAIVTLGFTHGQRLRRALEITAGVAVGVAVGETFVYLFGIGWWQILVIVGTAMTIAALLDQGTLIVTQAGIQGMIVALLAATPHTAFGRWFEALIGCVVGLAFASIVPTSTLVKPRWQASKILDHLAVLLASTADALTSGDVEVAEGILAQARRSERDLNALRGFVSDSVDVVRVSPFHRGRRADVEEIDDLLEPMDRAVRNARVLIRRATVSLQEGEPVPPRYVHAVLGLARAVDVLADELGEGVAHEESETRLLVIGSETAEPVPDASLSAEVIRAQTRSMVVDLLMVLGLESEDARESLRLGSEPASHLDPDDVLDLDDEPGPPRTPGAHTR